MDNGAHEEPEREFEIGVSDISNAGRIGSNPLQTRSPRQRFRRLLTVLGIMALVLVVLALDLSGWLNPQQYMARPTGPLTLRPQEEGMNCLLDAAWSPQGTRIALLGDEHALICPASTSGQKSGLVTVFDATSGKLLATLHPDDAIERAIATFAQHLQAGYIPPAAQIAAATVYLHVLWSPDGRQLALTFSLALTAIGLSLYEPDGESEDLQGVLLLDTNGTHPQVVLQAVGSYGPFPAGGTFGAFLNEWDVHTGTVLALPAAVSPSFGVLMPALAYRWQTSATPVAVTPLSGEAPPPRPPLGPVGDPDGGSSFTVWQPGVVTGVAGPGADGRASYLPGVYELTSAFVAWSPDGRYLIDTVVPDGLLELPGVPSPTTAQLSTYGIAGVPLLPLRDAGLARALRASNPLNPIGTFLAWRPDGRVLAAYAPETVFAVPPVIFYDCRTGRQLASLLPPTLGDISSATALLGQTTLLRWSSDGAHLLLYALPLGQIVLFGPQLPR